MKNYLNRVADELLPFELSSIGALIIEGPKWCGKTTTALRHSKSWVFMQDTDTQEQNCARAKADARGFLGNEPPFLIDEWQTIPFIWDAIRHEVDRRGGDPGQFILTGSAVPPEKSNIQHTGAGRIGKFVMRPMSLWESGDSTGGVSLTNLFSGRQTGSAVCEKKVRDYAELLCRGGWPGVIGAGPRIARRRMEYFFDTLVESDICRVDGVRRSSAFARNLLRGFSRVVATQASYRTIRADVETNEANRPDLRTIGDYIDAFKRLYIIEDLPAWSPFLNSKTIIRTSDTRHFVDPSLACVAQDLTPDDLMDNLTYFGYLFESMVIRDLRVYAQTLDGKVYHYLDRNGLEADAVVHLRNGQSALVEVKLFDSDRIDEGAETLLKLASRIDSARMKPPSFLAVITATANAYRREDGVYVIPLGCLKP